MSLLLAGHIFVQPIAAQCCWRGRGRKNIIKTQCIMNTFYNKDYDGLCKYHSIFLAYSFLTRFVRRRYGQKDHIKIIKGKGCYSMVGRTRQGQQVLSIGKGCQYKGRRGFFERNLLHVTRQIKLQFQKKTVI